MGVPLRFTAGRYVPGSGLRLHSSAALRNGYAALHIANTGSHL